ncbi:MAG: electron transfer flavoprotein subunit alpha/FixB family protein [Proteobacteria bacterium]|nr:electron transfer flavoprotein subunit alpha/FixB family protein [Pseudomonadota bacterium]
MKRCILLIDHEQGRITSASYELLSVVGELAKLENIDATAVIVNSNPESPATEFSRLTGMATVAISLPEEYANHTQSVKSALTELFDDTPFHFLIACHSTFNAEMLPAMSVRLQAACITSIEAIGMDNDQLVFERTVAGGKLVTTMESHSERVFITVQAGAFGLPELDKQSDPHVIKRKFEAVEEKAEFLELKESAADVSALKEAEVIVAAGRGIEEEDNLRLIGEFADLFKRSAVAGSRPLCDIGWLEYDQQVGITGASVKPDLYIACGISGMYQHTAGMRESGYVVAINKDTNSPFFQLADICVVEDVADFIPLVLEEYKQRKS